MTIVYKRPGSPFWYVTKTRQSTKTVNRKQAEEFARKALSEVWRQTALGEYNTTWKELADDWLEKKDDKKTLDKDRLIIRNMTEHLASDVALACDITAEIIQSYAKKIATETSKSTANRHLTTIRAMLRRAVKTKAIATMPDVEMYSLPKKEANWLTVEQFNEFVKLLPDWVKDIAVVGAQTGMRASNVRGLRWSWINPDMTVCTVPAQFTKTGGTYTVPLSAVAREVIERQRGKNTVYVFVRPDGVCPIPDIRLIWEAARTKFGMPELRFHDLRHTWASWHLQNGTPMHIVQRAGGWASPAMLNQNYSHFSTEHLTAFADNLNKKV